MNSLPLKKTGFTLIELLLVVSITVLFVLFLIPEMINFQQRQELSSAMNEVVSALKLTQNYANNGVQNSTGNFIRYYRFKLTQESGDADHYYRGYEIVQVDENNSEVAVLMDKTFACPVCIYTLTPSYDFKVPTGNVSNLSGSSDTYLMCYPGRGEYTVTVDKVGKVYKSDFSETSCACETSSCNQ